MGHFWHPRELPCTFSLFLPLMKINTVLTAISGKSSAWFRALYTYMKPHSLSPTVLHTHSCCEKCHQTSSGDCHHSLFSPPHIPIVCPGHFIYLFCEWPHEVFPLGDSQQTIWLWTLLYTFSGAQHVSVGYCICFLWPLQQITTKFSLEMTRICYFSGL